MESLDGLERLKKAIGTIRQGETIRQIAVRARVPIPMAVYHLRRLGLFVTVKRQIIELD